MERGLTSPPLASLPFGKPIRRNSNTPPRMGQVPISIFRLKLLLPASAEAASTPQAETRFELPSQ